MKFDFLNISSEKLIKGCTGLPAMSMNINWPNLLSTLYDKIGNGFVELKIDMKPQMQAINISLTFETCIAV